MLLKSQTKKKNTDSQRDRQSLENKEKKPRTCKDCERYLITLSLNASWLFVPVLTLNGYLTLTYLDKLFHLQWILVYKYSLQNRQYWCKPHFHHMGLNPEHIHWCLRKHTQKNSKEKLRGAFTLQGVKSNIRVFWPLRHQQTWVGLRLRKVGATLMAGASILLCKILVSLLTPQERGCRLVS